jgi:hypothetical protein
MTAPPTRSFLARVQKTRKTKKNQYGTAFLRFLIWIYNLRVDHPAEDVCLSADNITAAFRRILYHPDMAILWTSVFQEFIVIPCGMIFGGRNSPSFYMIPGELRAHVASANDFGPITTDLSESIMLATTPSPRAALQLSRGTPDDKNPGAALLLNDPTRRYAHSSFVDDTGNAHICSRIVGAITNSILSAYVVRRAPCLKPFKWPPQVGFTLRFLGYLLDTQTMRVQWPEDKRAQLEAMSDDDWLAPSLGKKTSLTPRNVARPLGLIRHGALVSVIGSYLSTRLQHSLNDAIRAQALRGKVTKRWWQTSRVRIPDDAMTDIRLV